ncbi:hypothetical protein F5X98DRAFT_382152 [Xylaria grammica]|nr:hypothetical protein F5X98DRAFT_382152 [Xylaria grammica]
MRLYIDVLITRRATESATIAGYTVPKGSIVMAPTDIAHFDEAVWGRPDHPASEFWAYRHVQERETVDADGRPTKKLEFSISGKSRSFFPWGKDPSLKYFLKLMTSEILTIRLFGGQVAG